MANKQCKCVLVGDFTMDTFAGCLNNDKDYPTVESIITPFDQVIQMLTNEKLGCWTDKPDFAVIWTQPERINQAFNRILNYEKVSLSQVLEEVDEYASLLRSVRDRVNTVIVPTWVLPSYQRGFGMLDMRSEIGISNTLMRMNLRLCERLADIPNVYLLDTQRWIGEVGKKAFNPKLWYMGKIAFGNEVFKEAVKDVKSAYRGINGSSKKLIILDLDNTLWGGIVGDIGWENIRLGGHDYIGEAYVDFQKTLKSLTNRGILLGIVSKNEEVIALEAIRKHPEMVLRLDDFAGYRINWQDKAENIVDLVADLKIGLQSVVFIDDNPVERARVRDALNTVFVPEWPRDQMLYKSALLSLRCFDTPSITQEDAQRTKMYVTERQRKDLKDTCISTNEWLKSLGMKVQVEPISPINLERTVQLFNKTNQMNLTTRRMTKLEMANWVSQKNHKLWNFRVSDRFGDLGITGIISLEIEGKNGRIVDFILSCRVMGRKIEETMLYIVIKYARSIRLKELHARYVPTSKNKPCLDFWMSSGFSYEEQNNSFSWNLFNEYTLPDCLEIVNEEDRLY